MPEEYIVEPKYQETYKLPCPQIGKPCIKHECSNWRVMPAIIPSPQGLSLPPKAQTVGKCRDDWTYDHLIMLLAVLHQGMQQAPNMGHPPRGMGRG